MYREYTMYRTLPLLGRARYLCWDAHAGSPSFACDRILLRHAKHVKHAGQCAALTLFLGPSTFAVWVAFFFS
jgi:hypothetical protein